MLREPRTDPRDGISSGSFLRSWQWIRLSRFPDCNRVMSLLRWIRTQERNVSINGCQIVGHYPLCTNLEFPTGQNFSSWLVWLYKPMYFVMARVQNSYCNDLLQPRDNHCHSVETDLLSLLTMFENVCHVTSWVHVIARSGTGHTRCMIIKSPWLLLAFLANVMFHVLIVCCCMRLGALCISSDRRETGSIPWRGL